MDARRVDHQPRAGPKRQVATSSRQWQHRQRRTSGVVVFEWFAYVVCLTCLSLCASTTNAFDLNAPPPEEPDEWWGSNTELANPSRAAHQDRTNPSDSIASQASGQDHDNGHERQQEAEHEREDGQKRQVPPTPPPLPPPMPVFSPIKTKVRQLWRRAHDVIPPYFDFNKFVTDFKRKYKQSEAYLRKSIFMRKVVNVFGARVDFRMGRIGYKQAVNKFSDKSPEEFNLMFQTQPPPDMVLAGVVEPNESPESVADYQSRLKARKEQLTSGDTKDLFLLDIPTQSAIDDAPNSEETDEQRAKRLLNEMVENQRRELAEDPRSHHLASLMDSAVREELYGMQFESMTQSTLNGGESQTKRDLPKPGMRSSIGLAQKSVVNGSYVVPDFDANDALDWSEHKCFFEVHNQGDSCGRCYVMAATALAEFYSCTERGDTIKRRKFSKDYVTDCAQKFSPNVMGCAGGSPYETLRFMATAGVYNIKTWKTKRAKHAQSIQNDLIKSLSLNILDIRCPLDFDTPYDQWGHIKVKMNPMPVHVNDWLEALEDGPLVASVQMPPVGVDSYAGGVHDGQGCESSGFWHAMLLVGYGISERGQKYWRFRNSFGPDWGDHGHFNLAMEVPDKCLSGGVRVFREPCTVC